MTNPLETLWDWAKTAPLPVVLALVLVLGGWVYSVESQVAKQDTDTKERLARMEATLAQVDTNVQTLLKAVLWEQTTRKENK